MSHIIIVLISYNHTICAIYDICTPVVDIEKTPGSIYYNRISSLYYLSSLRAIHN